MEFLDNMDEFLQEAIPASQLKDDKHYEFLSDNENQMNQINQLRNINNDFKNQELNRVEDIVNPENSPKEKEISEYNLPNENTHLYSQKEDFVFFDGIDFDSIDNDSQFSYLSPIHSEPCSPQSPQSPSSQLFPLLQEMNISDEPVVHVNKKKRDSTFVPNNQNIVPLPKTPIPMNTSSPKLPYQGFNQSQTPKKRKNPKIEICSKHKICPITVLNDYEFEAINAKGETEIYIKRSFFEKNPNKSLANELKKNWGKNSQNALSLKIKKGKCKCDCLRFLKKEKFFQNGQMICIKKSAITFEY